ncbi:hypothetical protein AGDE_09389 [Angomonas deanei]|uniref:Uncharacterized protein n=1 Tax=Angomonas deanei TaxID=59799 RepID=A0A7G2CIE1_9TRYP|nr:hypothetical protein AGDE_09389 [Angomonas deanei]CAD2218817.1 hypothetical protein, conserved [Angomonas deanei]|eukprot:EPY30546.1 hypothetical protein AGDE_09389 [Angomonas deanei]
MLEALFNKAEVMQIWRQFRSTEKQMVVESQSELLFILNVMLSTFYFSEIWQQTREANWLQRAVKIFDSVFGLDSASGEVVDVLPHVEVPEELKRLSRFQPAPAADTKDADDGVCDLFKPNYPSHWQLPPFKEMSNKADRKSNYWLHKGVSPVDDDEEFREEKGHHHGPDTIRKLELLRGVHEFWHAQDVSECQMLLESHNASYAGTLGYKILTILRDSEDSCVETAACDALEALVRAYSYPFGSERYQTCSPQSLMAKDFMRRVLVEMVYNGTRVPSLPNSISPSKRLMGYFCLLGELIRYHFGNAKYLCDYVEGLVPLAQLRKQTTSGPRRSRFQPSRWRQEDPILQNPPLERQEEEPFGSVFLRRLYENPNDSNLLLRSLILTLTPGLRSSKNYIHKQLDGSVTLVPHSELPFSGRSADLVINHHYRLGYVRTTSRQYTIEISKLLAQHPHATREEKVDLAGPLVVELLRALVNSPHRLTPDERPYPDLLSENDISYVLDERVIPSHSPPAAMAVSLFEQSRTDSDGLSALAPLVSLLDAPHRLLYACIQSFNMEYIQSTARLCVITTAVLLCLRVSHLYGGEGAIIALLESVRPFALDSLAEWRKVCEKQRRKKNTPQCSCNESSGKPCQSFLLYGCCNPQHDSVVYHNAYGGCFYRNFFRLLCLWFGHYWTCQRYVGTLYFCSEIPFAEYKNTALTLMKHLPSFFLDKDEE